MINIANFDRFFDVIIISGTFLITLFSIHLWFAKQKFQLLNRFVAVVLLARVGQNVVYILLQSQQLVNFPYLLTLFIPFSYAAPACLYLYVDCIIKKRTHIKKEEWLHFIPAVLAFVETLPWYFSPSIDWELITKQIVEDPKSLLNSQTGFLPYYYHLVLRPPLFIVYLFFTWRSLIGSKLLTRKNADRSLKIWLLSLLVSVSVVQIIRFLPLISNRLEMFIGGQSSSGFHWFIAINALVFLSIVLYLLYNPNLLYGYLLVSDNIEVKKNKPDLSAYSEAAPNKIISDTLGESYLNTIEEFMSTKKPFLKNDFQIIDLAQELNIPMHHCSFVINSMIGSNFRDWVNSYRIKDFIKRYPEKSDKMTIEAIANESGFKSGSTFYRAFKKETGGMPKTYFKE